MVLYQNAGAGNACLAAVYEAHPQYGGDGRAQIGIIENGVRTFARQAPA